MDSQRLKTLRELALRGTMAAVSESLHLSPSAVSQQITVLEAEVGVALIERRGRGVQLTEAGWRLVQHADAVISALEAARADMAELRGVPMGEVRIATFPSIASRILPAVMEEILRDHPGVALLAEEIEPIPALNALRSWQCDIAFFDNLSLPKDYPLENLEVSPVYDDRLVAVLPEQHPLASRSSVPLRALREEPWAIDTRPNTFSDVIFAMCEKLGFRPRVVGRFDAYDVISALVAQGCAVSVLPEIQVANWERPGVSYRPLLPDVRRSIRMAVRKAEVRHPALQAVVSVIARVAADFQRAGGTALHASPAGPSARKKGGVRSAMNDRADLGP
jgi:DNA-binding transcriptional LysR family regulator